MRRFALRYIERIWFYASLLGFAGIGHLLLGWADHWHDGLGIAIAWGAMFVMALVKTYLEHIASGIPFWPRRWTRRRRRIRRQ